MRIDGQNGRIVRHSGKETLTASGLVLSALMIALLAAASTTSAHAGVLVPAAQCDGDALDNELFVNGGEQCPSMNGGAGEDGLTVREHGYVFGNVNGGPGNDRIDIDGWVGNDVDDDSGDDIITIFQNGTVVDSIIGGFGNDTITTKAGSSVGRNILGQDGDDKIYFEGGTLGGIPGGGNIYGGADNDDIKITGGTIEGSIDGGEGELDEIYLHGGLVKGNVFGGLGQDIIEIKDGVTVELDIFGDDGLLSDSSGEAKDRITMLGGLVKASIFGEGGDDEIKILDGTVSGSVYGGDGLDEIELAGGEVKNIYGGDDKDTIKVLDGVVLNNVTGDGGDDEITIASKVTNNVFGNEGDDDIFIKDGADVSAVVGGDGNDEIKMDGGEVENIFGDGDNDIIEIYGGVVYGNVEGGDGNDTISTKEPGTVVGDIDGGAGDDIITTASDPANIIGGVGIDTININPGTLVTQNVYGDDADGVETFIDGDRGDFITMNGGEVRGNIFGEGGDDEIDLIAGIIGESVFGGEGADKINLGDVAGTSGTSIDGDIDGGAGADEITITSGSVRSVFGGTGGETMRWSGGTISQSIDLGAQDDTLTIVGTGNGGSASQSGLTALDGGDGDNDRLILSGVVEDLADPTSNWEFIDIQDNANVDLGDDAYELTTGVLSIDSTSRLTVQSAPGGVTYTVNGNITNAGTIDMAHGGAFYDTLVINGNYNGDGALASINVDTLLGAAGSPSDVLRVASTSGTTALHVFDTDPAGPGVFNPIGIDVVRVENDPGNTAAEHFSLVNGLTGVAGPIQKDLWIFDLALDDTRTQTDPDRSNADVHVLYSRPTAEVQFTPYLATGALNVFYASLDPWVERQHMLEDAMLDSADSGKSLLKDPTRYSQIWVTAFGQKNEEDSESVLNFFGNQFTANMNYDQNTYGIQAGVDFISALSSGGKVLTGIFGGYVESEIDPEAIALQGDFEGGTIGAYANYYYNGLSVSAVVKADFLDLEWSATSAPINATANADSDNVGGRVELAYKKSLTSGKWIQPYASVTYVENDTDRFTVNATTFDIGENESVQGRAGLRFGADVSNEDGSYYKFYAGVGVVQEFEETRSADILSGGFVLPLAYDVEDTSVELLGGVKMDGSSGVSFAVTSSAIIAEDAYEIDGKATVTYKFGAAH